MSYLLTPLSPLSTVSTIVSPTATPVSPVIVRNNYGVTTVTTTPSLMGVTLKPYVKIDYDSGLNDNYLVQKDTTKYLMYKMLDKWLYKNTKILKMLKVENNRVVVVKSEKEAEENNITNDSREVNRMKSDYIHENILTESATRKVLLDAMYELRYKWYELTYPPVEDLMKDMLSKYIKKKLRKRMNL